MRIISLWNFTWQVQGLTDYYSDGDRMVDRMLHVVQSITAGSASSEILRCSIGFSCAGNAEEVRRSVCSGGVVRLCVLLLEGALPLCSLLTSGYCSTVVSGCLEECAGPCCL